MELSKKVLVLKCLLDLAISTNYAILLVFWYLSSGLLISDDGLIMNIVDTGSVPVKNINCFKL
jgi:hypothetical protein